MLKSNIKLIPGVYDFLSSAHMGFYRDRYKDDMSQNRTLWVMSCTLLYLSAEAALNTAISLQQYGVKFDSTVRFENVGEKVLLFEGPTSAAFLELKKLDGDDYEMSLLTQRFDEDHKV